MPHEVVLDERDSKNQLIESYRDSKHNSVVVGWNEIGWVQVSVAPPGWDNTGDWNIVDLDEAGLDKLIRFLKHAKKKGYPKGQVPWRQVSA